jgi:hypothetical protein
MTVGLSRRLRLQYPGTYLMYCPGCGEVHELVIGSRQEYDKMLGFDGDWLNPTFDAIVRVFTTRGMCSFELRAGMLTFTISSFHDLAGKTVELPTYPLR